MDERITHVIPTATFSVLIAVRCFEPPKLLDAHGTVVHPLDFH